MKRLKESLIMGLLLCAFNVLFAQQLRLGSNPFAMEKSAVLDLVSDNQGLLLPRLSDTVLINSLNPPDGMLIFFSPSKQLFLRTNGYWTPLTTVDSVVSSVNGNKGALTIDTSYISDFYSKVRSLISASGPVTYNNGQIGMQQSTTNANGFLTSTDWNTFNNKQANITAGTTAQYWRGDKTWQTLNSTAVGLGNVPNIDATNASNLSSGSIPAARFGSLTIPLAAINATGTPSSANYLRGDGTWTAAPAAISTLNGLTAATQTFATGTTGTDFNISSAGSTHTFNMPVASATNTGKLSSSDWSSFNNKLNSSRIINTTAPLAGGGNLSADLTLAIATNGITNNLLRQSAALSVIGNETNATANVADITASTDGHVLRRSGTSLGFGTVATAGITNSAVTYAKIQNVSTNNRLLGRSTTGAGPVEEISIGTGLALNSGVLELVNVFGQNYQFEQNDAIASTTSPYVLSPNRLRIITPVLPLGTYRISFAASINNNHNQGGGYRVRIDNLTEIFISSQNSGTPDFTGSGGHHVLTNFSGVHIIDLDFFALSGTTQIKHAKLEIFRVN